MWEAIAANRRRSMWLILLMGAVLVTFGACLGAYYGTAYSGPEPSADQVLTSAAVGAGLALVLWLVMWLIAFFQGDSLLLRSAGAQRIQKVHHPRLWNVVEEMTIASGLPQQPHIYIVEDHAPNAFAVGRKPEKAAVAITSGLMRLLNRDELQGVVAHEIAHIKNLDIRFMTIAAVLAGTVETISRGFLWGSYYGAGRRRSRSRGGGSAYLMAIVFILAIVSPILVRLLYLACSRQREYLADASAARFTRFPDGLASALEKLAVQNRAVPSKHVTGALAPLYIVNPLQAVSASGWFSTHPVTESRVKILRGMGGGAGYVDYEAAFRKIEGQQARLAALESAAQSDQSILARSPSKEEPKETDSGVARAREVADLLDQFALYTLLPCACGMRIKVPPEFQRDQVECPRCERVNTVPKAEPASQQSVSGEPGSGERPVTGEAQPSGDSKLEYTRRDDGWDAFRCACGQTIRLGPDFPLDYTVCGKCNRRIELRGEKPGAAQ